LTQSHDYNRFKSIFSQDVKVPQTIVRISKKAHKNFDEEPQPTTQPKKVIKITKITPVPKSKAKVRSSSDDPNEPSLAVSPSAACPTSESVAVVGSAASAGDAASLTKVAEAVKKQPSLKRQVSIVEPPKQMKSPRKRDESP
jgi:hypothetical protein